MDTMAETETKRRPRRRHTDEFKAGAVRLVLNETRPAAKVAGDLDVSPSPVHLWVRQAKVDSGEGPGARWRPSFWETFSTPKATGPAATSTESAAQGSSPRGSSLAGRVRLLVASPLSRRDLLLDCYSCDRLMSPEARANWVEPDLRALPLHAVDDNSSGPREDAQGRRHRCGGFRALSI